MNTRVLKNSDIALYAALVVQSKLNKAYIKN